MGWHYGFIREDWSKLQDEFIEYSRVNFPIQSDLFGLQFQLAILRQNFEESVREYIERAQALVSRSRPSDMATACMPVLVGMFEGQFKDFLKLECHMEIDCCFKTLKRLHKNRWRLVFRLRVKLLDNASKNCLPLWCKGNHKGEPRQLFYNSMKLIQIPSNIKYSGRI